MKKKVTMAWFLHLTLLLILLKNFNCSQPTDTDSQDTKDKYIIHGDIEKTVTSFSRVEAVTNGDNSIDSFPKIEELWFNSNTNDFSGSIYLSHTKEFNNYSVYVNLYSVNSKFIGRSNTIHFNSNASIIKVPTIDPLNAVPNVFAGNDTILIINDSLRLEPTVIDLFGGIIESWEWDVGNTGIFHKVCNGDTMIVLTSTPNSNYTCIVKVTDNDGNIDLDTTNITILKDDPIPTASTTTPEVSINDSIKLQGTAKDLGRIIKWEWDAGNTGNFIETTPDSNYAATAPPTANSNYQSILRVTDDDGNLALDAVGINVILDTPVPTATTSTPEVFVNDTIMLSGTATDEYGRIVKWEWDAGNTGNFIETTPDSNYAATVPPTANSNYQNILRVTDDDNNVALDSVKIRVMLFSSQKTITTEVDGAKEVYAIDIDGDTDIDVLSASSYGDSKITWYENDGSQQFTSHIITTSANGASSVFAIDIDGDTDIDVLSASMGDDKIAWYENDGAKNFTAHTITPSADGAYSVFAIDINGDGDIDVLSASIYDNKIEWHENDGAENFTAHIITTSAYGAYSVFAIDINGDGDIDVLSASSSDGKIAWYENDGEEYFTAHTITTSADGARSVFAIDVDGDVDIDILSASCWDDKIAWYENDGAENFTAHTITTSAYGANSVYAIDLDGDGDVDVLSASVQDDKIVWYENDGLENFTADVITSSADAAYSVFAIDIDGDTDADVLSASWQDDKIAWYENMTK